MSSGRLAEVRTPLILSILMVLMTQVGYLDLMNAWSGDVETLDETNDVLETGGSGSASVYDNNKLTTGKDHACAVLGNGSAMCWGDDSYGQTGANGNSGSLHNLPAWVDLGAGRSAVAVGAGGRHTCVILDNGSLMCMGADNDGQVGDGASWPSNNHNKFTPVHVDLGLGRSAVAVAGGADHTCAILDNGSLMCWGEDDRGQIGDNSHKIDAPSPALVDVGAGRTVTAVSGGEYHTCAVLDDGTVKCWGFDGYGQLGNGAASSSEVTTPPSATVNLGQGRTALTITAGQHHSCAILDDGSVKCWGSDWHGQLGDGGASHSMTTTTTAPSTTPVDLGSGRTAVAISAGGWHTCAILDDGSVKCWGLNNNGQLGLGSSIGTIEPTPPTTPIDLGSGRTAVAIATGEYFTCATLDNGSLMCWGEDSAEQLGNGAGNSDEDEPIFVGGGHTWDNSTGLSSGSGSSNTLTASTDGAAVLLGDTMVPITFEYDAAVVEPQLLSRNMAMGHRTSCAIVENGSVACWGMGDNGQLGDGGQSNAIVPTLTNSMPGNMKAVAIDASSSLVCAVLENGSVACWGSGFYGDLGNGVAFNYRQLPTLTLPIGAEAIDVATRTDGACALLVNGSVSCWGRDTAGQLGSGLVNGSQSSTTQLSLSPNYTSPLPNGKKATAITAGYTHTCVLLEDGNVACWGSNNEGQLGLGNTSGVVSVPTLTLSLGAAATAIETDRKHTCALLVNGSVYCWGLNDKGQVGNGSTGQSPVHTPTFVQNLPSTVRSISTAYVHSCAILQNDSVYCWGDNSAGQLGKGTTSNAWTTSGNMPNATSSFASSNSKLMLDAGGDAGCALVNNGSIYCWGRNSHGNIGDGSGSTNVNANRIVSSPSLADTSMTFLTTHITELTSASACSTAPSLPTGLSIDSSTCTISGVPTAAVDNRTYNVTATVNGITFQTSIWLSTAYRTMTPSVDGADLSVGVDMQDITFDTGDIGSNSLAMTFQSTCAIIDNGTVKCWGNSANGRLGNGASGSVGSNSNDMGDALPITNLGTGRTAIALSSAYKQNYAHTCAVLDDGTVKCWGRNLNGQLGIGSTTTVGTDLDDMGDNLSTVDLGSGRTAVDIATGVGFTCALLDTGAVKCWGNNDNGQLGIGNTTQMGDHTGEMGDNLSTVDLGTGRTAVAVAAGYHHACAILDNGSVKCWGLNSHGQLGHSSTDRAGNDSSNMGEALPFTPLAQGRTAVHIDAGFAHTCVVFDNGSVKCWGSNNKGQLGLGTSSNMGDNTGEMGSHLPFVDLGTGRTAVDLTTMEESTCAVLDNGSVKCWGRNDHGQLGQGVSTGQIGHAANQMGDNLAVTNLGTGGAKVIAIGSGFSHACAVFDNGSLKCWGSNGNPNGPVHGWLGFPSTSAKVGLSAGDMGDNLPFVNLGTNVGMNGTSFTSCVASPNLPTGVNIDSSTCVISGAPTLESTNQTYTVTGLKNGKYYQGSVWLSASYLELTPSVEGAHLILDEAMTNITFQYNATAASGSGSGSSTSSSLTAQNIAGGRLHTCAIVDDGRVACWGDNIEGQLGDGTTTDRSTPTLTASLGTGRTAVQLATGDFFTCVLLDNDEVKCWGDNQYGQLGDGTTTDRTSPPSSGITFPTGRTPVALAAGDHQACAIMDDGSLTCWGNNHLGQIGDGTTTDRNSPTVVSLSSGDTVIKVGSGDSHSCALLDSGSIKCWGIQQYGQLGDGTTSSSGIVTTPALTNSLGSGRTAVNIGVGEMSTCALLDNDEVKCWGRNDVGELGDGTTTASNSPPSSGITFPSGETPVDLTNSGAGIFHYCALLDSGNVSCWGWNLYGTLGDGTTTNRLSPTLTDSLGTDRTAVHVTTGYGHTCALLDNGDIKCMGWNDQGQLGDGTTTDRTSPTLVSTSYTFNTALGSGSSGSGGGMIDVTGATACTASPNLPTGLNIDSSTCTISGTPTVEAVNATYEINATIGGVTYIGSVWLSAAPFGTITSAVDGAALNLGEAMTPIALNYTSQAPPGSSGNGTTWIPTPPAGIDPNSPRMADYFMLEHDDVIYFDAMMSNNRKAVYAFSTVNGTMWNTYDISSINSANNFQPYTGDYLAQFVGDDLFFTIKNGSGISVYELWVYSTSNGTTWRAMQQTASTYGIGMEFVIGDRLYFDESHYGSQTFKFGVYDTSNHTYWNHSTTILSTVGSCGVPGANFHTTVGDTIYFDACDASQSYGNEMYAFNTINGSYWRTTDLDNGTNDSNPGERMHIVIDDVIYFDAQVGTGAINTHALYAYNTSNGTSWLAADLREPGYDMTPHSMDTAMPRREPVVIGDTLYFDAAASPYTARTSIGSTCTGGHTEIYAYNINNETAWCVADAGGGGWSGSGHNSGAAYNMLHLIGDVLLFDAETGSTQGGAQTRTNSLWAHNLSNGSTWEITTKTTSSDIISEVGNGFTVFSTDNALYFPARNNTVGMEVWGYDVVNETYWLVNDTCPGVFNGISGGSFHTLVHQGVFYSSVRISNLNGVGKQHILGIFNPVPSSSTSSGGSGGGSSGGSSGVTWSTHPALPAGMSISAGVISGTPTVYALNQTYTIYANQSGYSTTHELYFSVDTDNAHTVVENQTIDPIGFHPPFSGGTTTWTVSPNLPASLTNSSTTGEITGTVTSTTTNATYTVTATHSDGSTETFTFSLRSLADYDGDGSPNDLPSDYDAAEGPTPGLAADSDDDGDGLADSVETDTGIYVDGTNTGTDPLNPDTDGDGICDGPNAVYNVCIAGPDSDPNGAGQPATLVAVNNTAITTLAPYHTLSGGTYEYEPDLPDGLVMNTNTGELSGTPTTTTGNITYTVWVNNTNGEKLSYTFTIEVLEDSDGDGDPNELPGDYDPTNPDAPGLTEDLDDDNDGLPDTNETETGSYVDESDTGTSPTNPDTDGDGTCDGPNAVSNVCSAGPDAFPHDPSADTDTDGDGQPDTIDGDSTSVPPLVEDEDDDGDGLDDVNETGTGTYVDESDTGTDPLDPDTDNDGICDGPNAVPPICVAGPDLTPLGEAADGVVYLLNNTVMSSLTPQATGAGMTYEIWPDLPDGLNIDATSGIISGTPTKVITKTNFTVYGNGSGTPIVFSFFLQVLEDTDRDGEPNELPEDYPEDGDLIEDLDDDGDGASDLSETGTGIYNGAGDLGTDSLNPDTDGDGICDGPNAVPPVCLAGPDSNPVGTGPFGPTVLVNNTEATPIQPPNSVPGATWELSPADLPDGLVFDSSTGVISGTPTESMENRTYTIWANTTDPTFSVEATFWLQVLEDYDGDGMPDELPDDYPDTGEEPYTLVEDEDDDNDGMSDVDEGIIGTEPRNPDTDGDGFCDGGSGVEGVCFAGPDSDPLDPDLPVNTDGDAYPDDDPDGPGGLTADDDDDNDGFLDTLEIDCASDPLDADDGPDDLDGDGICDLMDDDMDGDGIPNDEELGLPLDTASNNADTDGDGVCDGPNAVSDVCSAGPDAFPLDPAGAKDTDNDDNPDELFPGVDSTSEPPLVEDFDDDDDTWSDVDELACGTSSPVDDSSVPVDTDGDGVCDPLDPRLDLPFTLEYPTQHVDLFVNQTMPPLLPFINGSGEVNTWELVGELPEGLTFGWSPARDAVLDGSIRGTPVNATETVNLTVWANNTFYQESFALSLTVFNDSDNDSLPDTLPEGYVGNLTEDTDDDNDGLSDSQETACGSDPNNNASGEESWLAVCLRAGGDDRQDDGVNWMWCFPCLLLLLLLLVIPLLLGRDRRSIVMRSDGPEPENTTAEPNFVAGAGTEDDPFILAPVGPLQPGAIESTVEEITVVNMSDISVQMVDYNDDRNYGRFNMYESSFSMEGSRVLSVGKDGEVVINFKFDDSEFPTFEGGTYTARIKLGKASVHFLWDVTIMADDNKAESEKKNTMTRIKKRKKSFDFERIGKATKKDADDLQVIKGIGPYSEEKLNALGIFTYAQLANFDRATEDEVNDAIEHYKGRIRRDEWVKQAQDIIGAQAKADEEALKAAEEAQAKAEAEAKAAEEAEAAKKAEAEAAAAAKAAEEKAAKEAEKQAKAEAEKKAKEEAAAKKKAEAEAKKAKAAEEKAAKEAAAAAAAEEKAKAEAEKKAKEEAAAKKAEVEAKKKAKPATKETKKQEELERVKSRAKSIDFKVLGEATSSTLKTEVKKGATRLEVADTSQFADAGTAALEDTKGSTVISWTGKDGSSLTGVSGITRAFGKAAIVTSKDDLQVIKGIGPFIEEKLNALGITTYRQIANMNAKLEKQVNEAIEFFPGRVKRDQWATQAKILLGENVKLDEKALKQTEELERVAAKAEKIDFATLGVAVASEKDDLQSIKGIGPFIEEKLNALGIFTFEQVSKMTAKIEEEVNVAIEFFPGRVKRDEWAKQAKKLHKETK